MLETGDYFTQRMFGQIYLRKPPGQSWAIAIGTVLLGHNEWGARLVGGLSGVGMALLAYLFARRWFGPQAAMVAGLAQLLTPVFWKYQRSAEIEGLLTILSQLVMFSIIDLLVDPKSLGFRRQNLLIGTATLGLVLGVLVKGPAILVPLAASLTAVVLVFGWRRVVRSIPLGFVLFAGLLLSATFLGMIAYGAQASQEQIVTERVFGFHWSSSILLGMLIVLPRSLVQSFPTCLAIAFPWMVRGDSLEGRISNKDSLETRIARTVSLTSMSTVLIFALVGLTNERYTLPAFTIISVLVGFGWAQTPKIRLGRFLVPLSRPLLASTMVASGLVWFGFIYVMEVRIRSQSGREEGYRLAAMLPDGAVVWGDGLIDARPETLLYARESARKQGRQLTIRWRHEENHVLSIPPAGDYLVARTDYRAPEGERLTSKDSLIEKVAEGKVYLYHYELFRVTGSTDVPQTAIGPAASARRQIR
jgi:4-amino-4-deoxy-L-arabinose transferase-like glycosyltransferase